ncbi:MAG: kelch repeat-containing protein [Fimbriimonas sp.]|nr:kelch repeat-containing protein [Fimbriimonas sp.]
MLVAVAYGQTWTPLAKTPNISAYNPTLLTDGRVLVQDGDNFDWWILTPNINGSYLNGTWSSIPTTPGFGPLYYASQVLPDGRFLAIGGEYNFGTIGWFNQGNIYDPQKNTWSPVNAPSGWNQMGDTGCIMLPQGLVLVADPLSNQCVLFNPASSSFGAPFVNGKADGNDEEGLCLLPSGNVLTVDAVNTPNSEIFNSTTLQWSGAGSTINNLVQASTEEIGPMVLRPDGTVICFGGSQHNSIYNSVTKTWTAGPDFPTSSGGQLDCADAPACLLPSGKVICETSPGFAQAGVEFFEWNGTTLTQVPGLPTSAGDTSFTGNFLTLPTGELLFTNQSPNMYTYVSTGTPDPSWYPAITATPSSVDPGSSYIISGTQFNGMSGASAYGDDQQNQTNWPLVRITNTKSKHVFYCRAFSPSTYAVQTGSKIVSTNFQVPTATELGPSTIQVVTNGLASAPVNIIVGPPVKASTVVVYQGKYLSGSKTDVAAVDGKTYNAQSVMTSAGQTVSIEADFFLSSNQVSSVGVSASGAAASGVTGQVYLYDFVAKTFVVLNATPFGKNQTAISGSSSTNVSRFIGPGNEVRAILRGIVPPHISTVPFTLKADLIQVYA